MLAVVLAIVVSSAGGVWAERRWGGRAGVFTRRALLFVLYVVLPPVTFFNLAHANIGLNEDVGIGLAWVALAIAATLSWFIGARLLRLERPAVGSMICCTLIANTAYLGYPAVAALLGLDALSTAVAYDVLVATPSLLLGAFSVGAAFGSSAGAGASERVRSFFTRNPPLYAALLALVAPSSLAPQVLVDASRIVIVAMLPLGFFAVGAALAEEADEGALPIPPPFERPVAATVAVRLAVAPGLLYLLAAPLIDLPGPYLLLAAMPCGINSMIVAHAYGLDLRLTAESVTWSTTIAVAVAGAVTLLT
jgi:predicted permease